MKCTSCRHENPAGQKFCGECGGRLEAVCPSCQARSPLGQKFCGECGATLGGTPAAVEVAAARPPDRFASPESYTPKHLAEKILTSKGAIEGERKIVTVMFSDVSGFTAMSEKLDPEDVHGIMDRAFEIILNAVHQYEGTINQFLGDGVMALFGAPIAHEDHAQRALSAALAIQNGLKPLAEEVKRTQGIEFRMRMGINTGPVVVGAIGRDLRMDYTAVGDTTNLAARLLSIAKPGQIVTSRRTQNLRDGVFVFEDLGDFQLKGKAEPVRAYAVSSELSGRTRLEASKERSLTPLIGREQELKALTGVYRRAEDRKGAIALIVGDPGVGKSRLLYEFLQGLEVEIVQVLEATCASYGRTMAYRPVVDLLRRYLGLFEGIVADEIRSRVAKQHQFLGLEGEERNTLLAHFLGVSAPPEFLNRLSGPQLKARTLDAVRDVFVRASEMEPLILIVENMHWVDTASEEFLTYLAADLPGHRVLLVLTTRPGYAPSWLAQPRVETLTLEGLGSADVRGMARTLLAVEEVSEQLFKLLAEKSEGNPLYVEEILRQLQETGGIAVEGGEARLSHANVTVPANIHDIIAARVDRLAEALKQTLQGAAVVGRRFGVSLVSRVLKVNPDQVDAHLRELHGLDFVFPSAQEPEPMYSFKHALTQDVVYAGMLERRRRTYHVAAGLGLEELFAPRMDDVVELVAYHFGRGQVWDKAATYFKRAGAKALAHSAHSEAVTCFEQALAAVTHLPESRDRQEQAIDLRFGLRNSLWPLGQIERLFEHLDAATGLAESIGDQRRLGQILTYLSQSFVWVGEHDRGVEAGLRALSIATDLQDFTVEMIAKYRLGQAYYSLGDYRRGVEVLQQTVASLTGDQLLQRFGLTTLPSILFRDCLLRCLAELGEFAEGRPRGEEALQIAESVEVSIDLVSASFGTGLLHLRQGRLQSAIALAERALRLCQAHVPAWTPLIAGVLGSAYALSGRVAEALPLLERSVKGHADMRLMGTHSLLVCWHGEAALLDDRIEESTKLAHHALELACTYKERGNEGWAHWLLGEIAVHLGREKAEEAHNAYGSAIQIAEELGMRPLIARSYLGLGRLFAQTGDRGRSEEVLTQAAALFKDMEMDFWLDQVHAYQPPGS
jgi:class 3 adenylate cyclase/tetratricopeptide (TPR) repeat protein